VKKTLCVVFKYQGELTVPVFAKQLLLAEKFFFCWNQKIVVFLELFNAEVFPYLLPWQLDKKLHMNEKNLCVSLL